MQTVVETKHLKKYFESRGGTLHAVDDVSLKIEKGKTMGIVGESGCGKSTLGRTIIHLQDSTDGQIFLNGEDVTVRKGTQLKKLRERMQIIFQDPYSSLNPRMSVESIIADPLKVQGKLKAKSDIDAEVTRLMKLVGIEERLRMAYPHELDGGRRQRVGIARALALNPEFVVCDEPVSALDVSIQAQVLNLLMDLQQEFGLTLMFITHNLSVVRHISDDICVMYLGQIVESCETDKLFEATLHPYTKALLSAVPSVDLHHPSERILLKGEITSPIDPKPGCRFASRCPYATAACEQPQELKEVLPGHYVACCRCKEINGIH
ncbi:MAG: ATP-binding cassette domain-containing protein [Clostridiales bacterium]|nr:ATP-binding cassette domain-containing protein [Clostridiales bacterium]